MTSASTRRRHERNAELVGEWVDVRKGQRVTVRRDNGKVLKTVTESMATLVDGKHAMIRVAGIPGNTRLGRVRLGWNPDEATAPERCPRTMEQRQEVEIQRLRAAMVHAMDDCEIALRENTLRGRALTFVTAAHTALKIALEKK
jgi:hypothetical protein